MTKVKREKSKSRKQVPPVPCFKSDRPATGPNLLYNRLPPWGYRWDDENAEFVVVDRPFVAISEKLPDDMFDIEWINNHPYPVWNLAMLDPETALFCMSRDKNVPE